MTMPADTINIRPFVIVDELLVIDLWRRCGLVVPRNDPAKDIQRKLADSPELFLVAEAAGKIVGAVMAGYEGHRGWINYLAVDPACRRRGLGRQLMAAAETKLRALGCPKINLQVRRTNTEIIEFYKRIGFAEDPLVSLGKRLIHDQPQGASQA
jgi:ribosomal protein S18 acetylase RimI-like enzyme